MTSTDVDGIIDNYLRRLDSALSGLPTARREQLVSEIAEHLEEGRSQLPDPTEVTVRQLLDRVGRPEDIASEALADEQHPGRKRVSRTWAMVLAGVVLVVALGIALGVLFAGEGHKAVKTATTTTAPKSVVVPDVLGQTVDDAGNVMNAAGLGIVIVPVPPRTAVFPPGVVVAQSPPAGMFVARGSVATLRVTPTSRT